MKVYRFTVIILSFLLLAACGERTSDRALSGAGLGAAGGAIGGALVGVPALGAGLGAAGGAALGGLTSPNQVNLGRPVWQ